jgi:hypothetical protein
MSRRFSLCAVGATWQIFDMLLYLLHNNLLSQAPVEPELDFNLLNPNP